MPLNIKNVDVEKLVDEVARLTGESKTEAVRRALLERRDRLELLQTARNRDGRIRRVLEDEIWPAIPADVIGTRIPRAEEARILGFDEHGV